MLRIGQGLSQPGLEGLTSSLSCFERGLAVLDGIEEPSDRSSLLAPASISRISS